MQCPKHQLEVDMQGRYHCWRSICFRRQRPYHHGQHLYRHRQHLYHRRLHQLHGQQFPRCSLIYVRRLCSPRLQQLLLPALVLPAAFTIKLSQSVPCLPLRIAGSYSFRAVRKGKQPSYDRPADDQRDRQEPVPVRMAPPRKRHEIPDDRPREETHRPIPDGWHKTGEKMICGKGVVC